MNTDFLKKIQEADHATKKQVLFIASALAMLLVVLIWLLYFNNFVASTAAEISPLAAEERQEDNSFWGTMHRGTAVLYGNIKGGIEWLGQALQAPREYIVKPPQ